MSIDVAEQEVQQSINGAGTFLPADLPTPPIYSKVNPADAPILTLALTSDTLPLSTVEDLADTRLAPKISQLPGVGLVTLSGGQKPAVRIRANPTALASYGLNLEDVRTAVAATNVNQAKGSFDGPQQNYQIGANDQLLSSDDYAELVVAYRNGATGSPEERRDGPRFRRGRPPGGDDESHAGGDPQRAAAAGRQHHHGGRSHQDAAADADRDAAGRRSRSTSLTDRTNTIRASVRDVEFSLLLTIALVVAVIFLFLRTLSATIIPSVAVPLSIVGTFAVMYLLGYSLNNLTLMALTISTGFVVDDAIVMIENIARFIEEGESPMEAALRGSEQIGFTIISLTVSLIAVLIPLLFMGDIVGRLFREFAVTLAVTILISAVGLADADADDGGAAAQAHAERPARPVLSMVRAGLRSDHPGYGRTLDVVLEHQTLMLLGFAVTLALTAFLFFIVPKGFFPGAGHRRHSGRLGGGAERRRFRRWSTCRTRRWPIITQDPAVESLSSFVGIDQTNTTLNNGRMLINLKPLEQRDATPPRSSGVSSRSWRAFQD